MGFSIGEMSMSSDTSEGPATEVHCCSQYEIKQKK